MYVHEQAACRCDVLSGCVSFVSFGIVYSFIFNLASVSFHLLQTNMLYDIEPMFVYVIHFFPCEVCYEST
jgi:hypothetical protein